MQLSIKIKFIYSSNFTLFANSICRPSFDLFDEEKPFMQVDTKTAESVFKENSITSVSSINAKQCGGNNKVFFQHVDVNDYIENFGITVTDGSLFISQNCLAVFIISEPSGALNSIIDL